MSDPTKRIFQIHVVDVGPTPDAPPDPTSAIVASMIETVNSEIERGLAAAKQIVDATTDRANEAEREIADLRRQLADALAAVEEWRALAKRHETQTSAWFSEAQAEKHTRETLANDLAKCGEELTTARAENERLQGELANRVRIHVDEVSAERDRLRAAVEQLSRTPDALREELGIARESLRLCRRELSEVDRKLRDANADRDRAIAERDEARDSLAMSRATVDHVSAERDTAIRMRDAARTERRACEAECELLRKENCGLRDDVEGAIAERDEARKALADRGGVTLGIYANACRTRDEASAKLAALRARVAELEAELAAARNNPLSLFDGPTQTTGSYTKQIKPGFWFVGLTVNARSSTGASTEAIKRIAGWI